MMKDLRLLILVCTLFFSVQVQSQTQRDTAKYYLLRPSQIFDGKNILKNTWVLVKNNMIKEMGAGGSFFFPASTVILDMPNQTLLPGLIDGHTHLFLHSYTEASFDDQVLR